MLDIFTIVLNGMPFIQEQRVIFSKLNIPWRWHIVEGVAANVKCTSWCAPVRPEDHKDWLSNDGTTEYLNEIRGSNIFIHRKTTPGPWQGKLEMCNAALSLVKPGSVLHEIDVDEFWSPAQLENIYDLFLNGDAGRAWYYCDYYLGPDIHILNRAKPGNSEDHAWIRTHRYIGQPWAAHEPPAMDFKGRDVRHAETESRGLVFKHFAYVTAAQLRFKENYYPCCAGAVAAWSALQANTTWPTDPGRFLPWAGHAAVAGKTEPYTSVIERMKQ